MTSGSDDFLSFLTPPESNLGYRQGTVVTWNEDSGTNTVNVAGTDFVNLPIISQSDVRNIRPGDAVAVIRYNDSYAVLGKIKGLSQGTLWMPVVLYPQFEPLTAAGSGGYATVNAGTLVTWEGRIYATHYSSIHIDGVWGQASGSNTVTYELQLGGATVGTWTTVTSFEVSQKGPFNITLYKDQSFLKVEVKITSSVGSGTVAIQVLGCFLR